MLRYNLPAALYGATYIAEKQRARLKTNGDATYVPGRLQRNPELSVICYGLLVLANGQYYLPALRMVQNRECCSGLACIFHEFRLRRTATVDMPVLLSEL